MKPSVSILTDHLEDMIVEATFVSLPRHFAWQNTEFVIAATIKALREMAGQHFHPAQVAFHSGA